MNAHEQKQIEHFRCVCKAARLSLTPQRMAVYKVLIAAADHPTAEEVFHLVRASFPDISMDTVYRTLSTFTEIGLVHPVVGHGEPKRYDPKVEPHHHFRCTRCNTIIDFQEESFDRLAVPETIKAKYSVSHVKVILEGVCDKCSQYPQTG
jgi:Fur family peroxide stress response transcriptional regulator